LAAKNKGGEPVMWEYTYVEEGDIKKAVERLNELGKQGWEAFGYSQVLASMGRNKHCILLKRQK
jgi:hypothetical protein